MPLKTYYSTCTIFSVSDLEPFFLDKMKEKLSDLQLRMPLLLMCMMFLKFWDD